MLIGKGHPGLTACLRLDASSSLMRTSFHRACPFLTPAPPHSSFSSLLAELEDSKRVDKASAISKLAKLLTSKVLSAEILESG